MAEGSVRSNVYTALTFIALVALALGVAFVWYKNLELTGDDSNPFLLLP